MRRSSPNPRTFLVAAALVVVAIQHFVPWGHLALYPFTLLSTWVHEMGHGLATILVGGRFDRLEIFADASGVAHGTLPAGAAAWRSVVTSLGGLLAPPLVGGAILAFARGPRRAQLLLGLLSGALVLSLALWVRTAVGWLAMAPLALAFALVARRASPDARMFAAQFIAVTLALDTVSGLGYAFVARARVGGVERVSDIAHVAERLGGPLLLWGILVAMVSLLALAAGLWTAWRRPAAPST